MQELAYYIRRISELGLNESLHRAKNTLYRRVVSRCQRTYKTFFQGKVTPRDILSLTGFSSASELASHFRTRSSPVFFINRDFEFYRSALSNYFPGESEKIVKSADLVMRHTFDLLGSGPTDLDSFKDRPVKIIEKNGKLHRSDRPIGYLPWHVDFKSGVGWDSRTFYKAIRYGHVPGVDVKVPWELSRFQHLIPLAQAYCLTRNESYAQEFVQQVSDWIETNPCDCGVNWACTMDVGIRVVNWIWAFFLCRQSPSLHDAFVTKFVTAILTHARFIRRNLEFNSVYIDGAECRLNSNHYLSNIVGLLYAALLFPELKLSGDIVFARKELETELFHQTWPDGADYENSTSYHRLVSELFLSGFLLLRRNGHKLSVGVEERLQKMGEYVADYVRPDGTAPQIGDSDDGRLHPLAVRNTLDHSYLPVLVAEEFNRPDLRIKTGDPEVLWWIGATPNGQPNRWRVSATYGNQGFFILRGDNTYVHVSAAPVGMRGFGAHSHNDIFSFEYWANGHVWLVDPGTYIYTPDPSARNHFRSTESHNTVRIDGEDINPFDRDRLFQMSNLARVSVREWTSTSDFDRVDAEHDGYVRLKNPVKHRRCFELDKRTGVLTVRDFFEGSGEHVFEWFFHLSPEVKSERNGSTFILVAGGESASLNLGGIDGKFEVRPGWYSPSYGVRQQANVIAARLKASPALAATFTISPGTRG